MATREGFPYVEIGFDAEGAFDPARLERVLETLQAPGLTDVVFLCHGWNNDIGEARTWYGRYLGFLRRAINAEHVDGIAGRMPAIVAVFWPSKRFADAEFTVGNAHAIEAMVTKESIREQLALLGSAFTDAASTASVADAAALIDRIEFDVAAQRRFVDLLRGFWVMGEPGHDGLPSAGAQMPGDQVLRALAPPILDLPTSATSGSGGAVLGIAGGDAGGAGAASLPGSILSGARHLLNMTTYFTMKARAGVVGGAGLAPVVQHVRAERASLKVHLAGHSFGGRLVVAAATALPRGASHRVQSIFLMQAAFSHYGLAAKYDGTRDGFFRPVIAERKVSGPLYITFTSSDKAVGIAYPLASRLAGQVASGLGDAHDRYGGIGRNGAQRTPEVAPHQLLPPTGRYTFEPGGVYNLDANGVITGHDDICRPEVAHALASAIAST